MTSKCQTLWKADSAVPATTAMSLGLPTSAIYAIPASADFLQEYMVAMKPAVPAVGSRRQALCKGLALAAGVAVGACGGGVPAVPAHGERRESWLDLTFSISGGRLTNRIDPTGMPMPGGNETQLPFMFPVAVVASLGALFVADAGYGKLFRYQQVGGLIAAVPGIRINANSRVRVGPSGEIYVLDGTLGNIRRYSLLGQPVSLLQSRLPMSHYADFDVDPRSGRVFASDALTLLLDQIEPVGQVAMAYSQASSAGPLALDGGVLYTADLRCRCVNEWRDRRIYRELAKGLIDQPKALVASGGEIYVLDGADRSISRVSDGGLEKLLPMALGLVAPEQFSVSDGMMYVADGVGRTVAAFRIRPRVK
jgi:hypothetical protein